MSKKSTITVKQRSAFWRAHHAACINLGLSTAEEREETGKEHLAQLGRTDDFDKIMRRFAADSGDYDTACRFAVGDEARKAAMIRICCVQVMQLKGSPAGSTDALDYLAGIIAQARVPCGRDMIDSSFWMDVSPDSLMTLFHILDTHRRRLLRALMGDARTALGFDVSVAYELQPSGGVRMTYNPNAYADLNGTIHVNIRRD